MRGITRDQLTQILADHKQWRDSNGKAGSRADLADADLTDTNLGYADLTDANLAYANLTGAYLAGANFTYANLAGADLTDANLAYANLTGANLTGANLTGANFTYADLADAYRSESDPPTPFVPPDYAARAARYRERHPDAPVVDRLDSRILEAVTSGGGKLDMGRWHSCATTHCRAGWAITLAGDAGKALEEEHGPHRAGSIIYRASTGRVPHFFTDDDAALADIRACAEREALAAAETEA
jgi:hypothetical protein